MKEKLNLEEKDLDGLLNQTFLEENAFEADLLSAKFILYQKYDAKINANKEKELIERLRVNTKGTRGWNYFFVLGGALVITAGLLYLLSEKKEQILASEQLHSPTISVAEIKPEINPVPGNKAQNELPKFIVLKKDGPKQEPFALPDLTPTRSIMEDLSVYETASDISLFKNEELVFYSKIKNEVLEKLINISPDLYTKVGEGKVQFKGNSLEVDPFVIRNFAITNLEYKTFLADLLKNGRNDDYKIAAPKTAVWKDHQCMQLAGSYFQEEKYNEFPVVNISKEGALLFCSWLEKEINELSKVKHSGTRPLKVRLPYDHEWIYAAKTGYAQVPDCGGYNTIYDLSEGLIDKAFLKRISGIKKRDKTSATFSDDLFSINRYAMDEKEILSIFEKGIRNYTDQAADSIYPHGMDELGKVGHVSEIIQEQNGKIKVMGSCWRSKETYLKMLSEFNASSGSPFIGFRVVVTNISKASYKYPFW